MLEHLTYPRVLSVWCLVPELLLPGMDLVSMCFSLPPCITPVPLGLKKEGYTHL